jgi:hypothetical protein
MSMINCCMIICHSPISQNLCLIPPFSWVLYECKSNSFPVHLKNIFLVCNLPCSCQNKPNSFCYVFGEVLKGKGSHYQNTWEKLMNCIFCCKFIDEDKVWVPRLCCSSCSRTMADWLKGIHKLMLFAVLMVWLEPWHHLKDCCVASPRPL